MSSRQHAGRERTWSGEYVQCREHEVDLAECLNKHPGPQYPNLKVMTFGGGVVIERLGQLDARDIGKTIRVRDGGSTHEGELKEIQHSKSYGAPPKVKSLVILNAGEWRHVKSYPSDTKVEFVR